MDCSLTVSLYLSFAYLNSRTGNPIGDIDTVFDVVDNLPNYEFEYFVQFYDYKAWLSGCYKDLPVI
jgi:hypothetical protein